MIGQMATAIAFPGLNDHFLYRFSTFRVKTKNLSIASLIFFFNMHDQSPFFLALRSSLRHFQMPLEGLSLVKTLAFSGIIYATGPLLQNMTKIV